MTLPLENLDDMTFVDIFKEAISRIPVYAPGWTDHNKSDPGITFIELLSWLTEMQIYSLNRVGRRSQLKFLKLLGIGSLKAAKRAEVPVTFSLKKGNDPIQVPNGTVLLAQDSAGDIHSFETQKDIWVSNASIVGVFSALENGKTIEDNRSANQSEQIYFQVFGASPRKDDALYIALDKNPKGQSLTFAFFMHDEPLRPDADDESFKHYNPFELVWEVAALNGKWLEIPVASGSDETRSLTYTGTIHLDVPDDPNIAISDIFLKFTNKKTFLIRCRINNLVGAEESESKKLAVASPQIDQIILNTITALHGRTITKEISIGPEKDGLPSIALDLGDQPVQDVLRITTISNGREMEWKKAFDFDAARPEDCWYVLDRTHGRITFGDGLHGKIPLKASSIKVRYCIGGGPEGNVPAYSMSIVEGQLRDMISVCNPKAAEGGSLEETIDEAVIRARRELQRCRRAITAEDYETLALQTPGVKIKRAKAVPMYHPAHTERIFNVVTVVVVPENSTPGSDPSPAILGTVQDYLDRRRLLAAEVFVNMPEYIPVSVKADIMPHSGQDPTTILSRVQQKVREFLDPIIGGDDGAGWPFGRSVYLSEIYNLIDGVDGVDYVDGVFLKKENGDWICSDVDIPVLGLVYADAVGINILDRSKPGRVIKLSGGI